MLPESFANVELTPSRLRLLGGNTMQSEITERIVRNEIYLCQSSLVEKCFESSLFSIDDIENINDAETDEYQEIFE